MRTRADQKGDRYILNGAKMWITNGPLADTHGGLCQDRSDSRLARHHRLYRRKRLQGFSTGQKLDKLGMRGSDTGELVFEDCEVPAETCSASSATASTC